MWQAYETALTMVAVAVICMTLAVTAAAFIDHPRPIVEGVQ